jgi:hypothetical protein
MPSKKKRKNRMRKGESKGSRALEATLKASKRATGIALQAMAKKGGAHGKRGYRRPGPGQKAWA